MYLGMVKSKKFDVQKQNLITYSLLILFKFLIVSSVKAKKIEYQNKKEVFTCKKKHYNLFKPTSYNKVEKNKIQLNFTV